MYMYINKKRKITNNVPYIQPLITAEFVINDVIEYNIIKCKALLFYILNYLKKFHLQYLCLLFNSIIIQFLRQCIK